MNAELITIGFFLINLSFIFWIGNVIPLLKLSKQISEKFNQKRGELILNGSIGLVFGSILTFGGILNIIDGLTSRPFSERFAPRIFWNSYIIHVGYFFFILALLSLILYYFWRTTRIEKIKSLYLPPPFAYYFAILVKYEKQYPRSKYLIVLSVSSLIFGIIAFLLNGCMLACCMGTCEV